jgi:hypothetical protein
VYYVVNVSTKGADMRTILGGLLLAASLTACGGGSEQSPAEQSGCDSPAASETDELYVQEVFDCSDGGRLLIFADNTARDSFVEIAEGFGGKYTTGDGWAYEQP